MKFGSVALIGKSNVGKSTFINEVLKVKLSITSSKVQTTRNTIAGFYNDSDSQIIFFDTPGFYKTHNLLNEEMMKEARRSLRSADLILYFINSYDRINDTDKKIIKIIKDSKLPAILVANKVDLVEDEEDFLARVREFKAEHPFKEAVCISALNNDKIDNLVEDIKGFLDEGEPVYDPDLFTNKPVSFIVSEYIREKAINITHEEIPHSITVVIDQYIDEESLVKIGASIVCEKESQKPILIGKKGSVIKQIGIEARKDIEALLQTKVFLELFVKVRENWRERGDLLSSYGLISKEE